MKALQTQFDDKRLSNAVATPTCSSCCCCCCCLATSIASSTLLAQSVAKEGEKHHIINRRRFTVIAALFVPIVGGLAYFAFWTIDLFTKTCIESPYWLSNRYAPNTHLVCENLDARWMIPLLIMMLFLVLLYLYTQVHIKQSAARAALMTALIAIAFTVELFGGATLIFTGVGVVYLIMIPIVVGSITVWHYRHLRKKVTK